MRHAGVPLRTTRGGERQWTSFGGGGCLSCTDIGGLCLGVLFVPFRRRVDVASRRTPRLAVGSYRRLGTQGHERGGVFFVSAPTTASVWNPSGVCMQVAAADEEIRGRRGRGPLSVGPSRTSRRAAAVVIRHPSRVWVSASVACVWGDNQRQVFWFPPPQSLKIRGRGAASRSEWKQDPPDWERGGATRLEIRRHFLSCFHPLHQECHPAPPAHGSSAVSATGGRGGGGAGCGRRFVGTALHTNLP